MDLLLEGFLLGATLTIMIGPITFTILDASLTGGVGTGIVTALGMWCSDFCYIALCYGGAQTIRQSMQNAEISNWIGGIGGLILIAIGLIIWFTRMKNRKGQGRHRVLHLSGHWFRGFLVNSFAPFSLFFWPTVTLTLVLPKATSFTHAASFYVGVMASIMTGDTLKSVFAGWISRHISPGRILQIRTALALLFIGAGIFFIGKVVRDLL